MDEHEKTQEVAELAPGNADVEGTRATTCHVFSKKCVADHKKRDEAVKIELKIFNQNENEK